MAPSKIQSKGFYAFFQNKLLMNLPDNLQTHKGEIINIFQEFIGTQAKVLNKEEYLL
jgi:hypothetical protein